MAANYSLIVKNTVRNWRFGPFQILIILTLLQLSIALLTNGFALSADEAAWHYIGRNWFRNGLVPYHGGVDNKSPLFFAVFGMSDILFGVNYWFPRVLGTICQSVGIYFIYKIAYRLAGRQAGILAMTFYGLSALWHGVDGRYVSYTETYDAMFIILSFYFFLARQNKKGYFISGFLAALAIGFRLSAFFGIAAILVASLRRGKAFFSICAGLFCGILLLGSAALVAGIKLHDVYFYMFKDNFGQGSTTDHDFWWRAVQFHNMFFYSEVVLYYPLVITYLYIKKRIDWLVLWCISVFAGIILLGNYARVDLRDLLPSLALMGAFAVSHLIKLYHIAAKKVMLIIWVCFSPKIVEPFLNFTRLFTGEFQKAENFCHAPYIQPDESASRQLGLWVKANTKPGEKVLVAGNDGVMVQIYSERISPGINFTSAATPSAKEQFFADMKHNKAAMILVPAFAEYRQYISPDLQAYVDSLTARDYNFVSCVFNYKVYRTKR